MWPEADISRIAAGIADFAELREDNAPGYTRRAFTEAERAGRNLIEVMMRDAGLAVDRDGAGNVIGTLAAASNGPAITTGSHLDTVFGGGRFDGVVGVIGAIEAARILQGTSGSLSRDVQIIAFFGEETNDFGLSCIGSRAITGRLRRADFDGPDLMVDRLAKWR